MEVNLDSRIIATGTIVSISLIGLYRVISHRSDITKQLRFAEQFLGQLSKYGESGGKDELVYEWLTRNSNKMQNVLGHQGIFASYKPAGANYLLRNVPIILNLLPQLHTFANDEWLSGRPVTADVYTTIRDALIRHIGTQEEMIKQLGSAIRNPLSFVSALKQSFLCLLIYCRTLACLAIRQGKEHMGRNSQKYFLGLLH